MLKNFILLAAFTFAFLGAARAADDPLGAELPATLTAHDIVSLAAPGQDEALAVMVGAKPWKLRSNSYVVIACMAHTQANLERSRHHAAHAHACELSNDGIVIQDKSAYIAVIESTAAGKFQLVARYPRALDIETTWINSTLEGPAETVDGEGHLPEEFVRFDLAPYKLAEGAPAFAFGLRFGWHEHFARGGVDYQSLALFAISGNTLVNVFCEPMDFHGEFVIGESRPSEQGHNVLSVLTTRTLGYYDLQLKTVGDGYKQVFTWNGERYALRPGPKKTKPGA